MSAILRPSFTTLAVLLVASAPASGALQDGERKQMLQPGPELLAASATATLTGFELGTMWTVEAPPRRYWSTQYDFEPTDEWLAHVRLSSLRFDDRCSASFVSAEGLIATNHHCARSCLENLSTSDSDEDYVQNGFSAKSRQEELVCDGLHVDQLVDVTELYKHQIKKPSGATDAEATEARAETLRHIEEACEDRSGLVCEVVSLYSGEILRLYKFRRFDNVKLVFAPELQAASFGRDHDNFTYPRYALDVAFLRAYEQNGVTPVRSANHFGWSVDGPVKGEPLFMVGNPRQTARLATVSQLLYEARARHPFNVAMYSDRIDALAAAAARSPDAERALRSHISGMQNSLKAYEGQLAGVRDPQLVARKILWEEEFQRRVFTDRSGGEYSDVWDELAAISFEKAELFARLNLYNPNFFVPSQHVISASLLTAYTDGDTGLEDTLHDDQPFNVDYSRRLLEGRIALAMKWLEPDDPLLRVTLLPEESAHEAAVRLIAETRVGDSVFRAELMRGGRAALDVSEDPLVRLALVLAREFEPVRARFVELLTEEEKLNARLAAAMFMAFGTDVAPDATFTLRISDGMLMPYTSEGAPVPAITTFGGLFARSAERSGEASFALPEYLATRRAFIEMGTPLNFVTTNDMSGGNSGSAIIDRRGRVVGLAFDNNWENLPNQFVFGPPNGRAIGVHSTGILAALTDIYEMDSLAAELLGE